MRIRKCDYCGAEIIEGGENHIVPEDEGWAIISGTKLCERWEKDCCPRCLPKEVNNLDDK